MTQGSVSHVGTAEIMAHDENDIQTAVTWSIMSSNSKESQVLGLLMSGKCHLMSTCMGSSVQELSWELNPLFESCTNPSAGSAKFFPGRLWNLSSKPLNKSVGSRSPL